MLIKSVTVKNFRCHDDKTVDINDNVTSIIGKNGTGKTSTIEAIYIALRGSSFKGSDSEIVKNGKDWYRIELSLEDSLRRVVTFDSTKNTGKKQFSINDKKGFRLSPKDKHPVVLFEPDDLQLLSGSPSRRRRFIDDFISQIDPSYSTVLSRYERILRQRNALLKDVYSKREDFFTWDVSLSEYGSQIINKRKEFVDRINTRLQKEYIGISNNKDSLSVEYDSPELKSNDIFDSIQSRFDQDKILKHTGVGPHRHDVKFNFNNRPANQVASRGEVRSIVIALKWLEVDLIREITQKEPIILLDDVFSELDESRRKNILNHKGQIIITGTEDVSN